MSEIKKILVVSEDMFEQDVIAEIIEESQSNRPLIEIISSLPEDQRWMLALQCPHADSRSAVKEPVVSVGQPAATVREETGGGIWFRKAHTGGKAEEVFHLTITKPLKSDDDRYMNIEACTSTSCDGVVSTVGSVMVTDAQQVKQVDSQYIVDAYISERNLGHTTDFTKSFETALSEFRATKKTQADLAASVPIALEKLQTKSYHLVICDISLGAVELLAEMKLRKIMAPLVMTASERSLSEAVNAVKMGAYDYMPKPLNVERLVSTVNECLGIEAQDYRPQKAGLAEGNMVGRSEAMTALRKDIEKVAPTEARVLITGPNGSGKELVAAEIHRTSTRSGKPFVSVNCAAIPAQLVEKELFGHEKGAFTGALLSGKGRFELAQGGTLFLDEIGDMPLEAQTKLLRALQERKITRVGGEKDIPVDVRVLAATNKDLRAEIKAGRFREDLYHRLSVIVVKVPALSQRREDIPALVQHFLSEFSQNYGNGHGISEGAMRMMVSQPWTGNIRELRNACERLCILGKHVIDTRDVEYHVVGNDGKPGYYLSESLQLERDRGSLKNDRANSYIVSP